jgi:integrin alpha FG-GAP repeat containing protein 1
MFQFASKSLFLLAFLVLSSSATDISEIVFGDQVDLIPAAYGDFNSDELTDVFVLRDNFKTIDILLG